MWTLSLSNGQTCISTGKDPNSSCSSSEPCRVVHRNDDCPMKRRGIRLPNPIERCPLLQSLSYGHCEPTRDSDTLNVTESKVISLSPHLYSIDSQYFGVNISWDHPYNPTEGYELRIRRNSELIGCYCLRDPLLRNFDFDPAIIPNIYRDVNELSMDIEIYLLIGELKNREESKTTARPIQWPKSCLDISDFRDPTCGLPLYHPPTNITIHSRVDAKDVTLDVQWSYHTKFIYPTIFYVEVFNANNPFSEFSTFIVNNTQSIQIILQLNNFIMYNISIQPYVQCSGLANRTYTLGCGLRSPPVSPTVLSLALSKPPSRQPLSQPPALKTNSPIQEVIFIGVFAVIVMGIDILIFLAILKLIAQRKKRELLELKKSTV